MQDEEYHIGEGEYVTSTDGMVMLTSIDISSTDLPEQARRRFRPRWQESSNSTFTC